MKSPLSITPHLWFDKEALEAAKFYIAAFPDSAIDHVVPLRDTPSGDCELVYFHLNGQTFVAISAGLLFRFNPSISFLVNCRDQSEIDYYWERLSAAPEAEACGWLQDRFGVAWQVGPAELNAMICCGDQTRVDRLMQALLPMEKLDLAVLRAEFEGKRPDEK